MKDILMAIGYFIFAVGGLSVPDLFPIGKWEIVKEIFGDRIAIARLICMGFAIGVYASILNMFK